MYINNIKAQPLTPTPLKLGDEVCFGVNSIKNEFKYVLTTKEGKHYLKRCGCSSELPCPRDEEGDGEITPPSSPPVSSLAKRAKFESEPSRQGLAGVRSSGSERADGDETQPTGSPQNSQLDRKPLKSSVHDPEQVGRTDTPTQSELPTPLFPTSSPSVKPVVPKPSPALSTATSSPHISELSVEDALFPEGPFAGNVDLISDALFGEEEPKPSEALKKLKGADSATIQIELAKEEMAKEKHQLLSNIEALRSELAAKEELLTKRKEEEEKEAASKVTETSMLSSMEEEFTCVICQELFVNAYTLPCSHSYCEWCIKEWMKSKRQQDCPVCRKRITSEPVHSRALDNVISKMVEKMSAEVQAERKTVLRQHTESLKKLSVVAGTSVGGSASSGPTVTTTRSSASSAAGSTTGGRAPGSSAASPIVIDDLTMSGARVPRSSGSRVTVDSGGRITIGRRYDDDDTEDSYSSESSEETNSDSYDEGISGAYYGGYGRCFHCGKLDTFN